MYPDTTEPVLRILCVDDDPQSADILGVLLELTGFETRVAYDGVSALTIARDYHPDAAILDLTMPGMDGYELAGRLRELNAGRTPPVLIALTGWGGEDVRRRSAEVGFDLHLTKPVDPDQLALLLADIVILRSPSRPSEAPNGC
jgi:CheY-like chemotaxis protein